MFFSNHPYHRHFKEDLDNISPGLSQDLGSASDLQPIDAERLIALVLERGCQCQNIRNIILGREAAAELPRKWLLKRIERVAAQTLDLDNDDWEYRRLLEIAEILDKDFLALLIRRGLASRNPEIVEAANDFQSCLGT